ncbi:MAG: hypothetical protein KAJ19_21995, partial [Gammaproteobacteria bacterium]|nr:hypothetical protein [Gammaproteobacteria bacterium]
DVKEEGQQTSNKEVEELKADVVQLTKERDQARTLQGQSDKKAKKDGIEKRKLEIKIRKLQNGETVEDDIVSASDAEIHLKAKNLVQGLIIENADYQKLINSNYTLKEVLKNNPLALIGEYYDVEDAVDQIKEKLDKDVSLLNEKQQEVETEESGKEFDTGIVQANESVEQDDTKKDDIHSTPMDGVKKSIAEKIQIT